MISATLLGAILVSTAHSPVRTTNNVAAGFFVINRHCKPFEKVQDCGCFLKATPQYFLDDLQGKRTEVFLDKGTIAALGGPRQLLHRWIRATGEMEGLGFRMKNAAVIDAAIIQHGERVGDEETLIGLGDQAKQMIKSSQGSEAQTFGAQSAEVRPYITILCRTSDTTAITPRPASDYHRNMSSSYPGMDHYILNMSYGKLSFANSDTTQWINLPKPKADYLTFSELHGRMGWDLGKLWPDIEALLDASTDFRKYWGINIFLNTQDEVGGAYATATYVNADGVNKWVLTSVNNGGFSQGVLGHENGHNIGFDHSSGPYDTPYDSMWDVMSGGGHWVSDPILGDIIVSNGYNAHHRYQLGWIPRERVVFASAGTDKTFRIERLTDPANQTDALMAKIYIKGSARHYYTLESRFRSGYDKGLHNDCVIIHDVVEDRTVEDPFSLSPRFDRAAQVVDPDNNGDPNDGSAQWTVGESFVDAEAGIRVDIVSKDATGFTVRVRVNADQPSPGIIRTGAEDGSGTLRDFYYYRRDFPDSQPIFRIPTTDPSYVPEKGFFRIKASVALPEVQSDGLVIDGDSQTQFTGDTNPAGPEIMIDGSGSPLITHGLVISGDGVVLRNLAIGNFTGDGVLVRESATGTRIERCYIGLSADGVAAPNGWSGIRLIGPKSTQIGSSGNGNVISGNREQGISIWDPATADTILHGNRIGTDPSGVTARPNGQDGVLIANGPVNTSVGGSDSGQGNLLSGNGSEGLEIWDGRATKVIGNRIGTDATGTSALGNSHWGIAIRGKSVDTLVQSNIVCSNGLGIGVADPDIRRAQLLDNRVGTSAAGAKLGNNGKGVMISGGAKDVLVHRNVLSGNAQEGLAAFNSGTSGLILTENLIGTDPTGTIAIPNTWNGVFIGDLASASLIRNVISGNDGSGLALINARDCSVRDNTIGLNKDEAGSLANKGHGIYIGGATQNCRIGGPTGEENVIGSNQGEGIVLADDQTKNNIVSNNFIGLNREGTAFGNLYSGIWIGNSASHNIIGELGRPNIIGANPGAGIAIGSSGSTGNIVKGNRIGIWTDGSNRGNSQDGVLLYGEANGNLIGGISAGEGNIIAFNRNGIAAYDDATNGNSFRGNSIYSNTALGINLGKNDGAYGVSANDGSDADGGPNRLQNFPELQLASSTTLGVTVTGTLQSAPNRAFVVDLFSLPSQDPSGHGEGNTYAGSVNVTTNASGMASFTAAVPGGGRISALATDLTTGDTSEFSRTIGIVPGLNGLIVSPTTVKGGASVNLTVSLFAPSPSGVTIPLATSPLTAVPGAPSSVYISAGSSSRTIPLQTAPVSTLTDVTFRASYGGVDKEANLKVLTPALMGVTVSPNRVTGGATVNATVKVDSPAPSGGLKVSLKYSNQTVTVPTSATIPAGAKEVTVKLTSKPVSATTNGVLTATWMGVIKTATITVDPPSITGLTITPSSAYGGKPFTLKVTLNGKAPATGQLVSLKRTSAALSVPSTMTVPAGQTSSTLSVASKPVLADTIVTVTATVRGVAKSASATVLAPKLASISVFPTTVKGGTSFSLTATLTSAAPSGLTLGGSTSNAAVKLPVLTMNANNPVKTFICTTTPVKANTTVTIRVTWNGITRIATITLTP